MKKFLFAIIFLAMAPLSANATIIDAHGPIFWGVTSGVGTGRAQGFVADSDFSVSGIGIYGDLISQSFDIVVYSSTDGYSAGAILATASDTVGGTGMGWNDIALDFDFIMGNFYVVNWRPTALSSGWGSIEYYRDNNGGLPHTVGPLTLLEGFEGYNAQNADNYLHPRLRYMTSMAVPQPEIFGLFLLGLFGFGLLRRKHS